MSLLQLCCLDKCISSKLGVANLLIGFLSKQQNCGGKPVGVIDDPRSLNFSFRRGNTIRKTANFNTDLLFGRGISAYLSYQPI